MDPTTLGHWAQLLLPGAVTVAFIPLVTYSVRYRWNRYRWHTFEKLIRTWANAEFAQRQLGDELSNEDWEALAAIRMTDAGYQPAEIKNLTEPAVCFARALTSLEVEGRIGRLGEGGDHGEINAPPKG